MNTVKMWSYCQRALNVYPNYVFGTGNEIHGEAIKNAWKNRSVTGMNKWQAVKTGFKDGFIKAEADNARLVKENGGFFKNLWQNIKNIKKDIPKGWTEGGNAAKAAGKNVIKGKFSGLGKALGKKMPLIGSLMMLAFEIPNIFKATKEEGLISGGTEVVKAGVRLGFGAVGAALGSLIPVPFVGNLVGWMVGEAIGKLIVGKPYTEKKEQQEAEIQEKIAQASGQNIPFGTIPAQGNTNVNANTGTMQNTFNPYAVKPAMSAQELQSLAMQLYGGGANNYTNDYMYNTSGLNQTGFNKIA